MRTLILLSLLALASTALADSPRSYDPLHPPPPGLRRDSRERWARGGPAGHVRQLVQEDGSGTVLLSGRIVPVFGTYSTDGSAAGSGLAVTCDGAPKVSDLLSGPIAPGQSGTTGVTLGSAEHVVCVKLRAGSIGAFEVGGWSEAPTADGTGTWLEVQFQNVGSGAAVFAAEFGYGAGSGS